MTYLREELLGEINKIHMMNRKDPYESSFGSFFEIKMYKKLENDVDFMKV